MRLYMHVTYFFSAVVQKANLISDVKQSCDNLWSNSDPPVYILKHRYYQLLLLVYVKNNY